MITVNEFIGMFGNKARNEVVKDLIRSNNLPHEAASKCGIIDCQERFEHFSRFWKECNEMMVRQQMQRYVAVVNYLRGYGC